MALHPVRGLCLAMARHAVIGFRPFLPADAQTVADLFCASIETLASEDYAAEQIVAWQSAARDIQALTVRLNEALTILAIVQGQIVGFVSLRDKTRLDMLYVHPHHVRAGVGASLLEAIEKLAANRGVDKITLEASDNALGFFTARNYTPQSRKTHVIDGQWLGCTAMSKDLTGVYAGSMH